MWFGERTRKSGVIIKQEKTQTPDDADVFGRMAGGGAGAETWVCFLFFPGLEGVPSEPASASTLLTLRCLDYFFFSTEMGELQTAVTKGVGDLSNLLPSSSSSDRSSTISSPTSDQSISTPALSLWVRHWLKSHRREFYSFISHHIILFPLEPFKSRNKTQRL